MVTNTGTLLPTTSPPTFSTQNGGILVFDGTEDYISTQNLYSYSTTPAAPFSLGIWFKTSDLRGRKLIGLESSRTGPSGSYDRHLYVGTDGKLYFGVYNNTDGIKFIVSPDTYSDNYWYYASATFAGTEMKLYVNGVLVASGTAAGAEAYDGYWRIAGGTLSGWTNASDGTFTGSIGPVHFYTKALTAGEVAINFTAAKSRFISSSIPSVAAAASGTAITVTVSGGTNVTSYTIQRATNTAGPWTTLTSTATSATYSDTSPTTNTVYYYRAKFRQSDNRNSDWSAPSNGASVNATGSNDGLSFKTNFGPGTYLYNTSNWGTGAFYYIGGLDQSTGYNFTEMNLVNGSRVAPSVPVLYGNGQTNAFQLILPTGSAYAIPSGGPGIRDLSNDYFDFRFENVVGPPNTNITTACYIARKLPYVSPAQLGYNMFPGATQDMFYIRYWRKYKTGFFAAKTEGGSTWQTITSSKTDDYIPSTDINRGANRPFYVYQKNDRTGSVISDSSAWGSTINRIYRRSATQPAAPTAATVNIPSGWYDKISQVPAGTDPMWMSQGSRTNATSNDNWIWSTPVAAAAEDGVSDTFRGEIFNQWTGGHKVDGVKTEQALPAVNENEWILYEFAFKPSNSDSLGWQWAAVNGVQAFAVRGKNVPDIRFDKINRLGPFGYYIDGTQSGDARLGFWTTGLEVWEKWPSYAAPHPDWGGTSVVVTSPPTLTATATTSSAILLQMTGAPLQGQTIASYRIERSPDGVNNWTQLTDVTTSATTASFTNSGLAPATRYYYRARIILTDGNLTNWSATASATTLALAVPSAPTLTATATGASSIALQITATPQGQTVSSYRIERSPNGTDTWTLIREQASTSNAYSYTDTGLAASTRYYYRARFTQADGSTSAWSATVSGTTSGIAGNVMKWNPGHYAFPDHHMYPSKYLYIESDISSLVTPVDKRAKFVGVRLLGTWGMFEPTQGVYDFSKLDYFIAFAKARNLRVILSINVRRYGGTIPSVPQSDYRDTTLPDYVISNGWAGLNTDDLGGYSARLDITACMTAYLAMIAALGAHVNSEPYFEMFETGETSAAFAPGQNFSQSAWNTQWFRVPAALRAAFPNKLAVVDCNYHSSVSETNLLVDECIARAVGIGGPDTMPQRLGTPGDHWGFMHLGGVGVRTDEFGSYDFGTVDSRGSIPAKAGQEVVQDASFTPASIYGHAYNVYQASHMVWTMHGADVATRDGTLVPAMSFNTGVWPYLRDNAVPMRTGFPTRYTATGYVPSTGAT